MKPNPNRPLPVPESVAFRMEAGPLPAEAVRALNALEETEAGGGEDGEEAIPPVPESLRARWEEAYGAEDRGRPSSGALPHWVRRLAAAFSAGVSPARVVWVGAAAAACVAVLLMTGGDPGGAGPAVGHAGRSGVVTRGGGTASAPDALPIVVVADAEQARGLLDVLQAAFPARSIEVVSDLSAISAGGRHIVLDAAANTVTVAGGGPVRVSGSLLADPELAVTAIEDAEEPVD